MLCLKRPGMLTALRRLFISLHLRTHSRLIWHVDPQQYVRANIQGTLSLLDSVNKYGQIKRLVNISTDEVYGDGRDGIEKNESSSLAPTNPYAASKLSAEKFVDVYRVSLPVVYACATYTAPDRPRI